MHDLVVVGLGAMGAAVAWHGARLGLDVVGLDRHQPPHEFGSTHAETRITRLAVGEGEQYLPFVARSHELWDELERATGERLLHRTGGLIVTRSAEAAERWTDFTAVTADIAERAGITYEVFDGAELQRRQPRLRVPHDASVGFEAGAGIVMCERAVAVQLEQAASHGAEFVIGSAGTVTGLEPRGDHVVVRTERRVFEARNVVLSAGAWLPELLTTPLANQLTVTRQVVFWFAADDPDAFAADRFPFVMNVAETIDDYFAVFPMPPESEIPGVKVLGEQFSDVTTPATVQRTVSAGEIARFHSRVIEPALPGVSDRCLRARVCLYTNTPDDHFFIAPDPRSARITIMSPCSGHGFKHSTALGEAVAQRIAGGGSELDLAPFAALGGGA